MPVLVADGKGAMSSTLCIFNTVTSQIHTDTVGVVGLPPLPFVFSSMALLSGETIDNEATIISIIFQKPHPFAANFPLT